MARAATEAEQVRCGASSAAPMDRRSHGPLVSNETLEHGRIRTGLGRGIEVGSSGDRCWDLDEHSDLRQPYIVGAQS